MLETEEAQAKAYCRKAIELYIELDKKATVVYSDDLTEAYDVYVKISTKALP